MKTKETEPLVQLTDLTAISRDADRCVTVVTLYQESLRQSPVQWLRYGRGNLYPMNNHHRPGLWVLAARLGRGATDPEHDSAFAFKLPLVGVEIERVEEGNVWAYGFVDAYDGEEFHVPRPGYDPFKRATICRHMACGNKHPIVPEGCYVPKHDAVLYEAVKGRLVEIRMGVRSAEGA
jgi:hypothetical protein